MIVLDPPDCLSSPSLIAPSAQIVEPAIKSVLFIIGAVFVFLLVFALIYYFQIL